MANVTPSSCDVLKCSGVNKCELNTSHAAPALPESHVPVLCRKKNVPVKLRFLTVAQRMTQTKIWKGANGFS